MASAPARAGTLSAALLALVSAFFLGAATAAPATSDAAERAAKGQGSRAKRAACMRRVTRSRGVSRRVAARLPPPRAPPPRRRSDRRADRHHRLGRLDRPAAPAAGDARVVPAAATGCPGADTVPSAANVPAVRATVLCWSTPSGRPPASAAWPTTRRSPSPRRTTRTTWSRATTSRTRASRAPTSHAPVRRRLGRRLGR